MTSSNERRRFQRFILNRPASLVIDGKTYPGLLIDISLRGALVKADLSELPMLDEQGIIDIALDDDPEFLIRMQVSVRHVRDDQIGLMVDGLELEDASTLKRLVELNIGDPGLLYRELGELTQALA